MPQVYFLKDKIHNQKLNEISFFHFSGRVNQSQVECTESRNILKICELKQEVATNRVAKLQSQLKSAIKASR